MRYLAAEGIEDPPGILEVVFENRVSRPFAHLAVVHPEFPLRGRHHDLGIWISGLVVGGQKPVDMIAMEMGNYHRVYAIAVDSCCSEIGLKLSDRTFALFKGGRSETGVHHDQFRPGVDHDRGVGVGGLVSGQITFGEGRADFVLRGVYDVVVGPCGHRDAIANDGDLVSSDVVTKKPGACVLACGALARAAMVNGISVVAATLASAARRLSTVIAISCSFIHKLKLQARKP